MALGSLTGSTDVLRGPLIPRAIFSDHGDEGFHQQHRL